ncbi:glycosyltransferase [Elioraea sp.]|uniref:glycosyltransferase n=1 Tax=Elioraea sp. TaxID=2185103 RepID=UPI0025BFF113|nr:glycosyltransferase [Elioraea sp.]
MPELPQGFRLLVVVTGLGRGGTERHLAAVLPALVARGAAVRVIALRKGGELADALRAGGVAVEEAGTRVGGALAVLRAALFWRPTVTHFFLPEAYLIGGVVTNITGGGKRVMSRRSLNAYQTAHPRAAERERALHARMDALVGNSAAICAELVAEGAPRGRVALLRNGIVIGAPAVPRAAVRESLGIGPDALVITCVANLIPYKGHAELIEAFGRARKQLPPGTTLVLAGRDEGMAVAITAQSEAQAFIDDVRILGERTDIAELLGASDMFVLASHEEGSPNAVIEAMGAGLPPIVTDVGGSPEAVGEAGVVVPARDAAALTEALVTLGSDAGLRARLGAAAAARARNEYGLAACVERYVALYAALIDGREAGAVLPAPV